MIKLRDYQEKAVELGITLFSEKDKNGIICAPTGSGKSLIIAGLANSLDKRILVLQPNKEILEQNYGKLYEFGCTDISMFSASVGIKQRAKVTFATIGSIINCKESFSDVAAVIIDECHLVNSKGGQYKELLEFLKVPCIGLSATPYRMATSFGGTVVEAKFLHRTRPRIFNKILHVIQNADLHNKGYLSPIKYIENKDYDPYKIALNSTGLNYDDRALSEYNKSNGLVKKTVDTIISNLNKTNYFLVFVSSIEESKEIETLLSLSGIVAKHVDGKTNKKTREQILGEFKDGKLKVVTNVGVLTTGFDFPALDGIVLSRPTMSISLYYQMIGRGVRVHESKETCIVYDLCGNVDRFGKPEEYTIESVDDYKYRLKSGKKYLTGVNFVSGRDLEKQREYRSKRKKIETKNPDAVPFGKYAGTKVNDLPKEYLQWCKDNFDEGKWKTIFTEELSKREAA